MARYQVILAYDGTEFAGFQRQARARTVQGEVEAALGQLGWAGRVILAAGRTDTGVHASGNVIAFDLEWRHPLEELQRAINGLLPADIAVKSAVEADPGFHPRFDALSRIYRYQVYCRPQRDPLRERYAWRVWPGADLDRLQQAAGILTGVHDFSAFGAPPRPGSSPVRVVMRSEWSQTAGELVYRVEANAFLYHMVRRMVFLQVQVAQGRLGIDELERGFSEGAVRIPGLAPAHGLALDEVVYPPPAAWPAERHEPVSDEDHQGLMRD